MPIETDAAQLAHILSALHDVSCRLQAGDAGGFAEFYEDWDGVTLFGAMGGCVQGKERVDAVSSRVAAKFGTGGKPRYQVLGAQVEGNFAYIAGIEHIEKDTGPLALRATHVFWKTARGWKLLHRHADALRESPFEDAQPSATSETILQ